MISTRLSVPPQSNSGVYRSSFKYFRQTRQRLEADRIEFTDEDKALQCHCHFPYCYGSETWTFLKADERRLEAFPMNCQRRLIRWFHFVTNTSVTSQTGEEGLAIRICRRRLSVSLTSRSLIPSLHTLAVWTARQWNVYNVEAMSSLSTPLIIVAENTSECVHINIRQTSLTRASRPPSKKPQSMILWLLTYVDYGADFRFSVFLFVFYVSL